MDIPDDNSQKMKSIIRLYILLTLFMGMALASYAQADKSDIFVLEGHRQMTLGNHSDAFELIRHALELNPKSVAALEEMGEFWHFMHNDSMAIVYMSKAAEYAPNDYWVQQPLVELYVNSGKYDEAIHLLEEMSVKYPAKEDILMMLESLYQQKGDFKSVIGVLDKLELKEGKSEQLSREKFRTYMQMGDEEHAFAEISALADEYPNDLRYRVLLGDMHVGQQHFDEALKVYKSVEAEDPTNISLMASMLNYYAATHQDSLYRLQLDAISTNEKLDGATRLRFLNSLVMEHLQSGKDHEHLMSIFDKVLQMPQSDIQIAELCARYLITIDQPAERVKPVLNQIIDIDPENTMARSQLLQYATEADDTLEIIRVCRPAVDLDVDDPVFYYYLGIAYYQTDSAQRAVETFKRGFTHVKDATNLQLVTNMYALMGDSYHKLGDMQHAYESYDSCLVYRPDEALVLNNYAYYLSLERKQLDKAEEMSRRSLEKNADNHTYLDTYAWILFQQKRYTEAKEYIDKALSAMGSNLNADDANIIEHAGDIYAKCKLMEQALNYWQLSASLAEPSPVLLKKISKRKYYAY